MTRGWIRRGLSRTDSGAGRGRGGAEANVRFSAAAMAAQGRLQPSRASKRLNGTRRSPDSKRAANSRTASVAIS